MQKTNDSGRGGHSKDLPDSPGDKKEMQEPEMTFIDLPDVKDIPGQENIIPAPMGELADETISSADEEGETIFENDIDEEIKNDPNSNVSGEERDDLAETATNLPTEDEINLREATLDHTDDEGTPLNENDDLSGHDLDVPGAEDDDRDEAVGEEDEENNEYSLGGDNHDDIPEDDI
jgi:hypothetical protein